MGETLKVKRIFDPIYGFIRLTPVEWEIIHSPFYQRLRWIKQLGFSFYLFPGAEHSRFGHSIGVMHNAHKILQSCGKAVSEIDLMSKNPRNKDIEFHQALRLGALMHDLGTFMFSHTTEMAYIKFAETTNRKNGKGLFDDHEHLGSFIIKNTDYVGGITHILKKYGHDPQKISDLVKGKSPSILANQILHSEIDCDRMDYLLRDAYYTGLKYGTYDRYYLLHHFKREIVSGNEILTIKENAVHCVSDFLSSRFNWYSQVIRSPRGAKYDAIAERICFYLLEKAEIHKFSDLLEMILKSPERFYQFNDSYFMGTVQECYMSGKFDKNPSIKDMASTLLFSRGAKTIKTQEFKQLLLNQDDFQKNYKIIKKAESKVKELLEVISKKGEEVDWIIPDLPTKEITFVKSYNKIVRDKVGPNLLLERDPVKISFENGEIKLLAEVENSIISSLQKINNFIPNVFCSYSAYDLLRREGLIETD
jgi:HD superfamily phosphohydrolase